MLTLVIGNKNYSSWSMRAWLCLRAFQVDFKETMVSLNHPDIDSELRRYSESAKVPVLLDGDTAVWDSLAIAEYIVENYAPTGLPKDRKQRATARAISAEMHSSFYHLRKELPMNIRAHRQIKLSAKVQKDIRYIDALWKHYSAGSKEGWLFDTFSMADCMYAPVASRFKTYAVTLSDEASAYQQKLLQHASVVEWSQAALKETEIIAVDEAGIEREPPL